MMRQHYSLRCQACHSEFPDDGFLLRCPNEHEPSLLVTDYADGCFEPDEAAEGIYRYSRWLPIARRLSGVGKTITYRSDSLCRATALANLWIGFNGYWPEKGAALETATFKELEAYAVLSRLPQENGGVLVAASAGNTAAALARVCSLNGIECLVVVPECGLQRMQFAEPLNPCVKLVALTGFTDYYDAISLAGRVAALEGFFAEGGVSNVARRDGMGTTMLDAAETIGRLPDCYFQAVGSGAGAIAAHEAARRLIGDGRFGRGLPRLMLSQNLPFVPIHLSWKAGRRELISCGSDDAKRQIRQIVAHVLSNRHPPYSVRGGVFDVVTEAGGDVLAVDNAEALSAAQLFEDCEGIDIDPAGAIALASLIKAARRGQIDREAVVLLNITGGGWHRREQDKKLVPVKPDVQVDESELESEETLEKIVALVSRPLAKSVNRA